jgi:hypothetical protein
MTGVRLAAFWASTLLVGTGSGVQQPGLVVEPSSGRAFPITLRVPGGGDLHTLVGTGIRTKTFLRVKVYAFGLYVDAPTASSALQAWAGRSARDLEQDQSFYSELLEGRFGMTLRLVMTRDVSGDDMAEAFDEALRPRVVRAARELNMPGGEAALTRFRGYFDVEELTEGTELLFSWLPDGTLVSAVRGEVKGEIPSAALGWALFDVYLGAEPISEDGKRSLVSRFPELLAGTPGNTPQGRTSAQGVGSQDACCAHGSMAAASHALNCGDLRCNDSVARWR